VLNKGRLIALDSPANLTARVGGYVVESVNGARRSYTLVKDREAACARAQAETEGVLIRQANLEDVFIQLTGERLSQ